MTVSNDLRAVERDVDNAYRASPLLSLPRSEAMWYFLAECEELYKRELSYLRTGELQGRVLVDGVANLAKWPLRWLWCDCAPRGKLRQHNVRDKYYASAEALAKLGRKYVSFEAAFSYATEDRLDLELDGRSIRPMWASRVQVRYDAYDRLRDYPEKSIEDTHIDVLSRISEDVKRTVQVRGDRFEYALNPRIFKQVYELAEGCLDDMFRLPEEWQFPTARFAEYAAVLKAIWVLSCIHRISRLVAAGMGCRGYSRALVVMERDELITRLSRYLSMDHKVVLNIVQELTFGGRDIGNPDIALQPLVPLEPRHYGWAPSLVLGSSLERNLLVLLNRIPEGKTAYSHLSMGREKLMRESLRCELADMGLRFWSGNIPGWEAASDVDLAIIDDRQACCLILELKAFIEPADPREVRDKAEAIEKGVEQVERRREAMCANREALNHGLKIDDTFAVYFAVASESSVGCGMARVGNVSVVRNLHLIERIRSEGNLSRVCEWLSARGFLPIPGRDYEDLPYPVTIENWTLEWYQIKPLTEHYS